MKEELRSFYEGLEELTAKTHNYYLEQTIRVELEKMANHEYHLAIVGSMKKGKSTLINQLLGIDLLPVGVIPTTSIVTRIRYGQEITYKIAFESSCVDCTKESFLGYVTESGNPGNHKSVKYITITCPSDVLMNGLVIIDTPGIGSLHLTNDENVRSYHKHFDGVLFISSITAPLSNEEVLYARELQEISKDFFYLINKVDEVNKSELVELMNYHKSNLKKSGIHPLNIFMVSALMNYGLYPNEDSEVEGIAYVISTIEQALLKKQKNGSTGNFACQSAERVRKELENEKLIIHQPVKDIEDQRLTIEKKLVTLRQQYDEFMIIVSHRLKVFLDHLKDENQIAVKEMIGHTFDEVKSFVKQSEDSNKVISEKLDKLVMELVDMELTNLNERNNVKIKEYHGSIMRNCLDMVNRKIAEINQESSSQSPSITLGFLEEKPLEMKSVYYTHFQHDAYSLAPIKKEVLLQFLPSSIYKKRLVGNAEKNIEEYYSMNCNNLMWEYTLNFNNYLLLVKEEYRNEISRRITETNDYLLTINELKLSSDFESLKLSNVIDNLIAFLEEH